MATAITNFGLDTSCVTSLRTGRYATGARLVAEAAFRRLRTPRGTLRGGEEEANYGLDIEDAIGSVQTKADSAALPGRIENELLKDERILSVTVNVSSVTNGPAVSWTISIDGQTAAGPFSLVLGINDVTVDLLGIQPES